VGFDVLLFSLDSKDNWFGGKVFCLIIEVATFPVENKLSIPICFLILIDFFWTDLSEKPRFGVSALINSFLLYLYTFILF
jgi:hypothetical protein